MTLPAAGLLLAYATALCAQQSAKLKPATIDGMVTRLGTGEPLRDVRVTVTGASETRNVTTDAKGRFLIAELAPGTYSLDASATLFVRARKSKLTLSPDEHLRDVNLQLTPAAVIAGRIYDQDRRPLPSVRVEALHYQYRDGARVLVLAGTGHSDDRGDYRIYDLQPDAYYIRATPSPTSPQAALAPVYYPGMVDPQDGVPITAAPGTESSAVDIPLGEYKTFSVQLEIAVASPFGAPGATFGVVRRDRSASEPNLVQSESLGNGVYRISSLTPGAYDIFARVPVRTAASEFSIQTGRISVDIADQDVQAGILAVRQGGSLTGQLLASDPLSVALDPSSIEVELRPMGGSPSILGTSSRNPGGAMTKSGAFTIPNVANDRFRIQVSGLPANVYLTSGRYRGAEVIDSGIDVDGSPQRPLELYLGGASSVGTIEGVVRSRNDQPADSILVVIAPAPDRRENPAAFRTAVTNQSGSFSVRGLLPGEYTVLAWEEGEAGPYQNPEYLKDFESRGVKATVEGGRSRVVDVRVIPVSGR
jgi:protocatechuate 3,4-dioxygenase beta subunit